MSNLSRFRSFIEKINLNNEKDNLVDMYISYMANRCQSMFKWDNLPDSVNENFLEFFLQMNGHVAFFEYEKNLYISRGTYSDMVDVYGIPKRYIVTNVGLNINKNFLINEDCIIIKNDTLGIGLYPLFKNYATLLSEVDTTLKIATFNARMSTLISASDSATIESAELYLEKLKNGEVGIIAENQFLEGLRSQPLNVNASNSITNLIELKQYLKASWYNDIGLNANFNMKRESLNSGETQLNNDALFPLVDNMLDMRKKACESINTKYNLNITVDFNSSWADNKKEVELEQESLEREGENAET